MGWFSKNGGERTQTPTKPERSARNGAAKVSDAAAATPLTPEQVQDSLVRSRRTLASIGEVVSVLMKSPQHQSLTLAQTRSLIAPAISAGQFMVATAHHQQRGAAPVALVLWAKVSAEVDRRLSERPDQPMALKPEEWTSGDIPWLIMSVGDQRMTQHLVEAVQQKSLKGRALKARVTGADGRVAVQSLSALASRRPEKATT